MELNGKRKQAADENGDTSFTESDQIRLQALMENGSLSLTDPAATVKTLDEHFEKFPIRTIACHLGKLRKRISLPKVPSTSHSSTSPTLSRVAFKPSSPDVVNPSKSSDADECDPFIIENMPLLRFTYMDPNSDQEKVVILLDLPGGSGQYEWDFNDAGDGITLRVEWSSALCNPRSMFNSSLNNEPKLRAMQDALLKKGISRKKIPKCCIEVSLGIKVSKEDDAWEITTITHEGNKILMIEFSEFREKTFKKMKGGSFKSE